MKRTIRLGFVVVLLSFVSAYAPAELTAGAAKANIVPPFPTHMGGFGDRVESFKSVHDPIFARALVIDDGTTGVCLIGSGLMSVDVALTDRVRQAVEDKTGIPATHVLVSCVHNHSAPSYYQYEDEAKAKRVEDFMVGQFTAAAVQAYANRVPALVGFRAGELHGATRNRQQNNETVIDPQVGVLLVQARDSHDTIATLFNFTGHPVIQGSENLAISGEYPGAACRAVEAVLGGVAIFTQGACGDITVHRNGDPWEEIERVGHVVAGEVIKTASFIRPQAEARLAAAYVEEEWAPKPLPPVDQAQADLQAQETALDRAKQNDAGRGVVESIEQRVRLTRALLEQAEGVAGGALQRPDHYPGSVQVMQIGDLVIVAVPGELFVEYALEMRQRTAQLTGKPMILVGYANGYIGYIVTPRAMETGGYEASVARVDPRSGRQLTEEAMRLVPQVVK